MVAANPELLSTAEAARILGVTPDRIRQMATNGDLVPVEVTSLGRLFARQSVEQLARQREAAARTRLPPAESGR
ncbi:MAG: helix-turn-helix domain-containing protein [Dehalococcoidia bacterium]